MTITRDATTLDTQGLFPRRPIVNSWLQNAYANLNGLYEAAIDATAPSASSQKYKGHDHGGEGGIGIINNSQLTVDNGEEALWEKTDFVSGTGWVSYDVGKFYVSPKLKTSSQTFLEIAICYTADGCDFLFRSSGAETFPAKATGDAATSWVIIKRAIEEDTDWLDLVLWFWPEDPGAGSITLKIHALNVVETYASSQPKPGVREPQSSVSAKTYDRYFGEALADELATGDYPLHADALRRLYSGVNALFEATHDQAVPGATSQAVKGHDHFSSGQLGRAIGHGKIYSFGDELRDSDGTINTTDAVWKASPGTQNVWEYADLDLTLRRTDSGSSPAGTATTVGMFWAPVSAGISSSGNPPSAAPYVEGWIWVDFASGKTVELKIENMTTSTYSETITPSRQAWNYIRYVPCSGNADNEYNVQVRHTGSVTGDTEIRVKGFVLSEAYRYNGNDGAYVSTSGDSILGNPAAGVRKVQAS